MTAEFTPLRVRSHGSLLYGTASPEALVARALELGYSALALADRDNLYLAIRFYRHARDHGLRPILAATVSTGGNEVLLVPLDRRGYAHLCAILTARQLDPGFDLATSIAARHTGLHVIVESPGMAATLLAAGVPAASGRDDVRVLQPGGLWLGVRGIAAERVLLGERVAAARHLKLPLVATGDVALLAATEHDAHRAAVTAAAGELLDRMPPNAFTPRDAWLASPAEWSRRVRAVTSAAGVPAAAHEALANNAALVDRCRLELDLGTPIFPRATLAPGETGHGRLARECLAGVRRRYGRHSAAARRRLSDELAMIDRLGFTDYFLLVAEIVGFARARGIPTVGRGSGASSLVAYSLGITNVDPIRHRLTFERFLNPSRRDCPDLDIDLCWKRRDEVIAHVYQQYGADRVAMISTHATLGARSAFRETAKALGVPNPRVNALAKRIPRELERPYRSRLESLPEGRHVDWSEPVLSRALALAEQLDGAPRHLSVHCGGMVIADRELTHYVPLEQAAKGVVVTQFEMRAIEAIGLVKMDLLGNRALTTIGECVDLVRAHRGVEIDVDRLPESDPITAACVAAGDTLNCFQLESPAMRHLLRMLDANTLERTVAAVAAVRPGPAEMGLKDAFCRRQRGLEPPVFLHPRLEPLLRETHGVMLYEEDVLHVSAAIAGLTLAAGDDLRRAIGAARDEAEFRALEHGFVAHALHNGVDEASARAVWRDLTRFGAYAFCKAHAAGYGALGWQSAYLKSRFPAEWAVGILNHHAGMYATWVHVEDLRRRGVVFGAPCVQRSAWETTLETSGDALRRVGSDGFRLRRSPSLRGRTQPPRAPGRRCSPAPLSPTSPEAIRPARPERIVRVGLSRVFGLADATGARIVAARAERFFRSLADFAERVRPALPELESLILAGALDTLGRTRPSLLLEARVLAAGRAIDPARSRSAEPALVLAATGGGDFLPDAVAPAEIAELPEFDAAERVRGECRATGLWFSGHPLALWAGADERRGVTPAADLERRAGQRVAVAGLPCARRQVETKSGGLMLFLTLADPSGLAECVLFPDAYRRFAAALRGEILRVEGRVDETLGAIAINVQSLQAIGDGTAEFWTEPAKFS